MMARSIKGSSQRPDTLMQDRTSANSMKVLLQRAAGPYIGVKIGLPLHDRFSTKNRHSPARIERPVRAMSGPTQCSKLHLRSNTSSARATSSGESLPQQLGGGPDDFTIAFHNYGIDKARIVFQPLNMLHGSFVIRTNRRVQNADLIGPL